MVRRTLLQCARVSLPVLGGRPDHHRHVGGDLDHSVTAMLDKTCKRATSFAAVALVLLAVVGCANGQTEGDRTLLVRDVAIGGDTEVVVVTSPASCGSCSFLMVEWIDALRRQPNKMRLFFTREPSGRESDAWRLARLAPQGIVSGFEDLPMDVVVVARFRSRVLTQIDTVRTQEGSAVVLREVLNELP